MLNRLERIGVSYFCTKPILFILIYIFINEKMEFENDNIIFVFEELTALINWKMPLLLCQQFILDKRVYI